MLSKKDSVVPNNAYTYTHADVINWGIRTTVGLCVFPIYISLWFLSSYGKVDKENDEFLPPWICRRYYLKNIVIKMMKCSDNFKNKRLENNYPVEENYFKYVNYSKLTNTWSIHTYCNLPYKNLKGIYLKHGYQGTISLVIGGQNVTCLYDSANNLCPKNLLDSLDNKLLLGLLQYNEGYLQDSLNILLNDDIELEYYDEKSNEKFNEVAKHNSKYKQYIIDSCGVRKTMIYNSGMFGLVNTQIPKTAEQRKCEHLIKKERKYARFLLYKEKMAKKQRDA